MLVEMQGASMKTIGLIGEAIDKKVEFVSVLSK